jgi:hypothetical protein
MCTWASFSRAAKVVVIFVQLQSLAARKMATRLDMLQEKLDNIRGAVIMGTTIVAFCLAESVL